MTKTVDNPEMHVDLMFPSKYLKAADFDGKTVTLTISDITRENLRMADNTTKEKYILHFKETEKQFPLNPTNARMAAVVLKEKKAIKWPGKKITLYPTTCMAFGKPNVPCIRVKEGGNG